MKIITRELDFVPSYDVKSICSPEEMLLFDIETTGLRKETTQLYLIGCAYCQAGVWYVRQWLTENLSDEYYVLEDFLEFASSYRTLVHFNGDRFDIPYLQYKCEYYRMQRDLTGFASFDIYARSKVARTLLGGISMSQKALEVLLGINREDQLDGGLLIPVYYEYEKTGAASQEELLLLHNYDDIQGMLKILPMISFGDLFEGRFRFEKLTETPEEVLLSFRTEQPLPVTAEAFLQHNQNGGLRIAKDNGTPLIRILVEQDYLQLRILLREGVGCYPLRPVSDYYYLPEEDRVIHRDVAQFLDRSKRRKATVNECFVRKEGRFFPEIRENLFRPFYMNGNRKQIYADWEEISGRIQADPEWGRQFLTEFARDCLNLIAT